MKFLEDIVRKRLQRIEEEKKERSPYKVAEAASHAPTAPGFAVALRQPGISLIAECKKASPSKGLLVPDYDPAKLAFFYQSSGARAISVLTEPDYFQGALSDVQEVRAASGLPVLRKDFILDSYQIYQAKEARASAVLLIVRILSDPQISDFLQLTKELHLDALVEVHNQEEMDRALDLGSDIIGINNRNLDTFEVDLETSHKLAPQARKKGAITVAESGISTREDVKRLEAAGVDAILIGESIVTSPDPASKISELLGS